MVHHHFQDSLWLEKRYTLKYNNSQRKNENVIKNCIKNSLTNLCPELLDLIIFRNYWSMEQGGIGQYVLSLGLLIPGYFLLLCLIEYEYGTKKFKNFRTEVKKGKGSSNSLILKILNN
jgi:hypothetical protein